MPHNVLKTSVILLLVVWLILHEKLTMPRLAQK